MSGFKKVLYEPAWQKLRVSCLAEYSDIGGFTTREGVEANLSKLLAYINDHDIDSIERAVRIWRVLNLLNAVLMGYSGQGMRNTILNVLVNDCRDFVQKLHNSALVQKAADLWSWEDVARELQVMYDEDLIWFGRIRANLKNRVDVAEERRRRKGKNDVGVTREELLKFVDMMDALCVIPC